MIYWIYISGWKHYLYKTNNNFPEKLQICRKVFVTGNDLLNALMEFKVELDPSL